MNRNPIARQFRALKASRTRGSAVLEFVVLSVLLMVPMTYLTVAVASYQSASYAATAASREGVRAMRTTTDGAQAKANSRIAVALALENHGKSGTVDISCEPNCTDPGSVVRSVAVVDVPLPGLPDWLRGVTPGSGKITATYVERVGDYEAPQ